MIPGIKDQVMERVGGMTDDELVILLEVLAESNRFTEKRRCTRSSFSAQAEYASSTIKGRGEIKDIGIGGVFLTVDPAGNPLFLGQDVALSFSYPTKDKRFVVRGKIVRATLEGVGVEFKKGVEGSRNPNHPYWMNP